MDAFTCDGVWWLPADPRQRIAGTLSFDPAEGGHLKLFGKFPDPALATSPVHDHLLAESDIILGDTSKGEITICACIANGLSGAVGIPFLCTAYKARYVFIGQHYPDRQSIVFRNVAVRYSYLDDWARLYRFRVERAPGDEYRSVTPDPRPSVSASLPGAYTLVLLVASIDSLPPSSFPIPLPVPPVVTLQQQTWLRLESADGTPRPFFDEWRGLLGHTRNFLTLGASKPVYPLDILALGPQQDPQEAPAAEQHVPRVKVYFPVGRPQHPEPVSDGLEMLFTLPDIASHFPAYMRRWFRKRNMLWQVFSPYFAAVDDPPRYEEYKYLNWVYSLEGYHRKVLEGPHRAQFSRTGAPLQISLQDRLQYLVDKYRPMVGGAQRAWTTYARQAADTRNYLVHRSDNLRTQAARALALYYIGERTRILVELCLMEAMGFDDTLISQLVQDNQRYQRVLH
jgi:hypothetical protein